MKTAKIYARRFGKEVEFRTRMYKVLCGVFLQKYVPKNSVVLDIGAGYCEFINNIDARRKIAVDINPDVRKFASKGVETIVSNATDISKIKSNSVDVAFTSNFFEHLTKEDIVKAIKEVHRVLRKDGKFLVIQPNIRYCYKDYWMFFDHITPLDDRSISEALETNGFMVIENRPKFLPYTTKSRLPKSMFLINLYLRLSICQKIFGKQAFIYAKKDGHN